MVVIGVTAATFTKIVTLAYFLEFAQFARIFIICITFSNAIVMIVWYTAMAIAMLIDLKTVRTNDGHQNGIQFVDPGPSAALGSIMEFSGVSKDNDKTSEQHRTATDSMCAHCALNWWFIYHAQRAWRPTEWGLLSSLASLRLFCMC